MNAEDFVTILPTLFRELVNGSPDPGARTYMLNRGDTGLLAALERLSAAEASAQRAGGPSIAAHVDHLRYGLSLLNGWALSATAPGETDWTASWRKSVVSEPEWRTLREEFARVARKLHGLGVGIQAAPHAPHAGEQADCVEPAHEDLLHGRVAPFARSAASTRTSSSAVGPRVARSIWRIAPKW